MTTPWPKKPLAELADIINGGTPSTEDPLFWGGPVAWCTPTDITANRSKYVTSTQRTITHRGVDASSAKILPQGAVLLCSRATVGVLRISGIPLCTNQGFKALLGKKNVLDNEYLYYYLLTQTNNIISASYGSTFLELPTSAAAKIAIAIPSFVEQQKIAAVLSDIDALIETQEALIAKKKDVKAATMELLLTGKKRLPGFNDEWIKTPIKNMATIGRGRVISHAEISRSMAKEFPVYSSQTSNDGIMGYIDSFDFEGEYVTWTTDGANAGRVFHRTGKFNCTNVCGALSCLPNVSAMFLASALNRVTRFSVSTNLANPKLMNGVMGGIRVDMPQSLAEQVAISALLHDFQLEIDIQETLLLKQKLRKSSVMHKLLTGEIRLP